MTAAASAPVYSGPSGSPSDRIRIYAVAFTRALATGLSGVLLGLYLATIGMKPSLIGLTVSLGLGACALAALFVTLRGDRIGRRGVLVGINLMGAAGGIVLAVTGNAVIMIGATLFGMINGMGRDRGAALVIDQVILPATTDAAGRTRAFAVYNVCQDIGHALGGLLAGLPTLLHHTSGMSELAGMKVAFFVYSALLVLAALLDAGLSRAVEVPTGTVRPKLSPESRSLIVRISSLFVLDSLGGGFLTASLLAWFFHERFGVSSGTLGLLFFFARVANAGSHLGAAWLAKRIGLVNTMVFTHLPSSLLLLTVPFAPSFTVAAIFFLLRESLVEMDVPTRQSYVMAVVKPEERTTASGVTHLVRLSAWAVAPVFAGAMMGSALGAPLVAGAGLKIAYDILLWRAFRKVKPPEEAAAH